MDEAKVKEALLMAQQAQQAMNMPLSNSTLQPQGLQMGAIGHPNGPLPTPFAYSEYNRVG